MYSAQTCSALQKFADKHRLIAGIHTGAYRQNKALSVGVMNRPEFKFTFYHPHAHTHTDT
jgi:hypothetical protein